MTKNDFYIIGLIALIIIAFILTSLNQNSSTKFMKGLDKQEQKHREELLKEIEIIKKDRELIQAEIKSLKDEIEKQEKTLITNIQQIKLKTNVQVRNLTDSTNAALLKDLLPK